jgi:hypothetical protein
MGLRKLLFSKRASVTHSSFGTIFSKGKKGFILSEALIIPLSLAIVGMMIFMASTQSVADEQKFEQLTPKLNYEYPKTIVYSFVNFPLSDNDSMSIFGDKNSRVVSDLIWLDSDESKKLIMDYKKTFIDGSGFDFSKNLELYSKFSDDKVSKSDLLKIKFEPGCTGNLESELKNNNFFLRIPKNSGGDVLVYFKENNN